MVLLSAHKDVVKHPFKLSFNGDRYVGLLDNWIGMTAVNTLLTTEPAFAIMAARGLLSAFFGDTEEWGTISGMPQMSPSDLVIVVDVCSGPPYRNLDFSLENVWGLKKRRVEDLVDNLRWEGFRLRMTPYTGADEDEDEAFYWVKKKVPVLSFIIPIHENGRRGTGWHSEDCWISLREFKTGVQGLKRLVNYVV